MPPKRKRRAASPSTGLYPGEILKRSTLAGNTSSPWAWVDSEVIDDSNIAPEHFLFTCGFSHRNTRTFCRNKYAQKDDPQASSTPSKTNGELEEDVIVISDDEQPTCSKKTCKANPYCLNYLGQDLWEDELAAKEEFMKLAKLGENPVLYSRDPDTPVGLRNLGATCYANASLQVWFRDIAFRAGVYNCQPSEGHEERFLESPIFQLQVTFAALQEGTQNVFNPTKLVESLQLRTAEQQDAQEFSKLFMSHLDAEFKKQSIASVRSLLTDQFQGKQVYGTQCEHCKYKSERDSDFLELEINFEKNAKLEDCISVLLEPEKLTGDNKYLCSGCESLQDATRYTELRSLPPVLHFSLLRFVYDLTTMERKKSKNSISFPMVLDMNSFLGRANAPSEANVYELRGVLLHKGASAYHGHYEAQVFDASMRSWFQFNDEEVTEVQTLGDKQKPQKKPTVIEIDDDGEEEKPKKRQVNTMKRRRVEDSDDEAAEVSPISPTSHISSKDAYMLVYAKKEISLHNDTSEKLAGKLKMNGFSAPVPSPPKRAMEAVNALNAAHDEACEAYSKKEAIAIQCFNEMRHRVMDIYRSWDVSREDEDYAVVSKDALGKWLSGKCMEDSLEQLAPRIKGPSPEDDFMHSDRILSVENILCSHGYLDHKKASSMKCISLKALEQIGNQTYCFFDPKLTQKDVCRPCVREAFRERLYQIEHPRLVQQFDEVREVGFDEPGYWISKFWLKDWRLAKPKMHNPLEPDPGPETPEFDAHVRCEHGGLGLHPTSRRRISVEACNILRVLYPSWDPISSDAEACVICETAIHMSREDRHELRKRAEDEKARLKNVHDFGLSGNIQLLEDVPCAIVPLVFVHQWRQWLTRPTEAQRPDSIDNSMFFCNHNMLAIDPNSASDLDGTVAVIKRGDWDTLETLYPAGPLIAIEKRQHEDGMHRYVHDIVVCKDCRHKRKIDWESTNITIRLLSKDEKPSAPATYTSRNAGARQSKRLREVKKSGEKRRIPITKAMTLKDIKVEINHEFNIATICQRLFYNGVELEDNTATVASLNILANDMIDMRQEDEVHEISDSDDVPRKKPRDEGRAFGGTLLGSSAPPSSPTSHIQEPSPFQALTPIAKSCGVCTYKNPPNAASCTICDTLFV